MRIVCLVLGMVLLGLSLVVAAQNWHPVPVALAGDPIPLPLGALPLIGILAGAFLGGAAVLSKKQRTETSQAIQSEWAAQDAKLVASVKSDREKQLEAKIATLETALKQALKKGS